MGLVLIMTVRTPSCTTSPSWFISLVSRATTPRPGFLVSLLLFMVPCDTKDITSEYQILLRALQQYNPELLDKKRILAVAKSDMIDEELREEIIKELPDVPYVFISSVAQQGLMELKDLIWQKLNE